MKAKVWLSREEDGEYTMSFKKPVVEEDDFWGTHWYCKDTFLKNLCPSLTKKYLGLKRHLRKDKELAYGELEIKFKELKKPK